MERKEEKERSNILSLLEDYIPQDNPREWAKLQSRITYRRLVLALLREILVELREINRKKL